MRERSKWRKRQLKGDKGIWRSDGCLAADQFGLKPANWISFHFMDHSAEELTLSISWILIGWSISTSQDQ